MGRALLVGRLALRDVRHRPAEAVALLVALVATTATLTLGLVLHGMTNAPYERTRAATAGPDVVAMGDLASLSALARQRGVTAHGGPYQTARSTLVAHGHRVGVEAQGRDAGRAAVDRPKLIEGSWVRPGGVVIERSLALALGAHAGDRITLGGRAFRVAGVASTAAVPPFDGLSQTESGNRGPESGGLVWTTRAEARGLASAATPPLYVVHLRLADPLAANAFLEDQRPDDPRPGGGPVMLLMNSWQNLRDAHANIVRNQRKALITGSWLLALLALASMSVLVGGRMAGQIRRVGLLKAVGGTPGLVAAILLAQYVALAAVAAAIGLALGRLIAPGLARPSAGLLGDAGPVPFTAGTIGLVAAVALGVAIAATAVPALRAARTSTVRALADAARTPRRASRLIALSARLPVPLLLGVRIAARRPRRTLLSAASITITVSGVVTALAAQAELATQSSGGAERTQRLGDVLLLITLMLVSLAAVNALFVAWATVVDARRSSALARALGATPEQVTAGLTLAQVLPTLVGALLGIPGGLALYAALASDDTVFPSALTLVATVAAAVVGVAVLTAIPSRLGARRAVADVLGSELA